MLTSLNKSPIADQQRDTFLLDFCMSLPARAFPQRPRSLYSWGQSLPHTLLSTVQSELTRDSKISSMRNLMRILGLFNKIHSWSQTLCCSKQTSPQTPTHLFKLNHFFSIVLWVIHILNTFVYLIIISNYFNGSHRRGHVCR